jgi:hypothetical protein
LNLALRLGAVTSSAFSPTDIANLQLWFDADDASSFTFSSGSVVSQWNDKSGGGRHVSQGTVANQPGRTGTQNGRATVVFDGNDYLDRTGIGVLFAAPLTVFVVFNPTASGNNRLMGSAENGFAIDHDTGFGWGTARVGVVGQYLGAILTSGTFRQICADVTSTSSTTGYLDGALEGTDTYSAYTYSGADLTVGAARPGGAGPAVNGTAIAELIVYSRSLNSTERGNVFSYLRDKWGVA